MIPQNELRTGNYVITKNILLGPTETNPDRPKEHVVKINHTLFQVPHLHNAIPITDDWLIRLGFKEYDALFRDYQAYPVWHDSSKSFIITGFDLDTDAPYYNLVVTNDDMTNSHCIGTEISYIHQLQNLYFAITGKELELKQNA